VANVTLEEVNAWGDGTKLLLSDLDIELEAAQASQVLASLSRVYDISTWINETMTPSLVRKIIAMMYMGWYYQKTYSEDESTNSYGLMLLGQADSLLQGLVAGTLEIPGGVVPATIDSTQSPLYYPTDASSALEPTTDDPSLGGPAFTMGKIW
jgi:hypothetical protein